MNSRLLKPTLKRSARTAIKAALSKSGIIEAEDGLGEPEQKKGNIVTYVHVKQADLKNELR